ncbi:hypothetical protein PRIPAC_88916 [Pristionchus pacificus]|uniref:Uncharacterized protein n=1 Tax=Pristionchus pacificus TaxID=54126 RepID=A0A2A6CVQ4_PRIPA|nr:hypothetical protein PRIPAC_88916 [Pristionchus pacificus]|eukprot:PDM82265.1 hypothetical protein PRIPAC_36658 [Pristionchus pacificus]
MVTEKWKDTVELKANAEHEWISVAKAIDISLSIGLVYVFFKRILGVYVIDIETGDLVFRDYDDLSYENDTIVGAAVIPGGFITMNIIGEVKSVVINESAMLESLAKANPDLSARLARRWNVLQRLSAVYTLELLFREFHVSVLSEVVAIHSASRANNSIVTGCLVIPYVTMTVEEPAPESDREFDK